MSFKGSLSLTLMTMNKIGSYMRYINTILDVLIICMANMKFETNDSTLTSPFLYAGLRYTNSHPPVTANTVRFIWRGMAKIDKIIFEH